MGIDALDFVFRLEKAFGVKFRRDWERLFYSKEQIGSEKLKTNTVTIGEVHERLCELLREWNLPVPDDSWERVVQCVSETLAIPIADIRPEHRFVQDLGAT